MKKIVAALLCAQMILLSSVSGAATGEKANSISTQGPRRNLTYIVMAGVAGAIMGHISLGQIKRTGEKGYGMALAGVIVGWVGVALAVIGVVIIIGLIGWSVENGARYGS